jgi:transposase
MVANTKMGIIKNKSVTKQMICALRGASKRERVLHRLHSVILVLNGLSCSEAGRVYGDSARSVAYWMKRYEQNGISGLEEEQRSGRPSKLTAAQLKVVEKFVQKNSQNHEGPLAAALQSFIKRKFAIVLTVRQCRRIMNRFRPKP